MEPDGESVMRTFGAITSSVLSYLTWHFTMHDTVGPKHERDEPMVFDECGEAKTSTDTLSDRVLHNHQYNAHRWAYTEHIQP